MILSDALGTVHAPCDEPCRVVSLVPSITELLWDLGLRAELVGRTAFCIHPREMHALVPRVGGTKDVDLELVRSLHPTHVIVNVDENRRDTWQALRELVPHVVVTHPLAPRDNLDLYRLLGGIFRRAAEAARLCAAFEAAWQRLAGDTPDAGELRALVLVWRQPWMTVCRDTYLSRMLALAGWRTLPAESAVRYPEVAADASWLDEIEVALLPSEPFPFRQRHVPEVAAWLPGRPVRLIDGEMISWYGSRAIPGLDYLRQLRRDADGLTVAGSPGTI